MRNTRRVVAIAGLVLSCSLNRVCAESDTSSSSINMMDEGSDQIRLELRRWEFGLQFGKAFATGNKSASIMANNSAFLVSDPGSIGEDEFSENGLVPPDFTGQTLIQGNLDKSYFVGAHLYYKLTPWIATGLEASYETAYDIHINSGGPFKAPIYTSHYRTHGFQQVIALRLGGWMGYFRPYVMAGAGPYVYTQSVTSELLDVDDADHPPVEAAGRSDIYASVLYGGGLDIRFFNEGSVGLGFQYQQVFSPGHNLQFIIPTARFAYHF